MKVILHIGPPKTGSTAIQSALFPARERLAEQGIYTFLGSKNVARSLSTLYDRPGRPLIPGMRLHFSSPQQAKTWSQQNWERLEAHVAHEKPAVTLLSSEHFAGLHDLNGFLQRLSRTFDSIGAIYYLREPASLYCSVIDQAIRGGRRLSDLPDPWGYNYPGPEQIRGYLNALGPDNVVVRSFQRSHLQDGDIRSDYFYVLRQKFGLDFEVDIGAQPLNESLSGAATAWMLTLNESFVRMPQTSDRSLLELRRELIRRLRGGKGLAGLPKLSLADHPFRDVVRGNARDTLKWFNGTLLDSSSQQPVPDETQVLPCPEDSRAALADWIFSYLTPEATQSLTRALSLPEITAPAA